MPQASDAQSPVRSVRRARPGRPSSRQFRLSPATAGSVARVSGLGAIAHRLAWTALAPGTEPLEANTGSTAHAGLMALKVTTTRGACGRDRPPSIVP